LLFFASAASKTLAFFNASFVDVAFAFASAFSKALAFFSASLSFFCFCFF